MDHEAQQNMTIKRNPDVFLTSEGAVAVRSVRKVRQDF